jgi:hypothetical protein
MLRLPPNFNVLPPRIAGLREIVAHLPSNQSAYVRLTTEKRRSNEEAIRRLSEVAQEEKGKHTFVEICGWPALERQYRVEQAEIERSTERPLPEAPVVEAATIAIAEADTLIRFQAELQPGATVDGIAKIFDLVRTISCPPNPDPGAAKTTIEKLKKGQPRQPTELLPAQSPAAGREHLVSRSLEPRQTSAAAAVQTATGGSESEIQITTSADGKTVVVGSNKGTSFSTNYGASFSASTVAPGFNGGDPTLGTGASGQFYLGGLLTNSTSCSAAVDVDTSKTGATFSFAGNAAFCPMTGSICSPDQPQMAVDAVNGTPSGDQLYVVWRNYTGSGSTCLVSSGLVPCSSSSTCTQIVSGHPTPTLSCSSNNGATWSTPQAVGSGDRGRVTVGPDGFVYVTYVSGDNLMLNKFSSCTGGLASQPGFPVTIASLNEIDCPVVGLDRCDWNSMASPQPAVSKDFAQSVYVAYAEKSTSDNDNIVVRHSRDGGLTWPDRAIANSSTATGHRFFPWICAHGNAATVSWYDRRSATTADPSLTNYFAVGVSGQTVGTEQNVSIVADSQKTPIVTFSPRYGDYNGNACTRDRAYVGWASATVPPGVPPPPTTKINVFVEAIPPGPPMITSVTPSMAVCGSASTVAINGANFRSVWLVELTSFNRTVPLSTFTVISPSLITASIPGGLPAGVYEVYVSSPSGGSVASTPSGNQFTVFPTVDGLNPSSGPARGGTQVTVSGTCFNQATSFSFAGIHGTNVYCPTSTQCTAVSPPSSTGSAGQVDVVAYTAGAASTVGADSQFTYIGPQITSINPSSGPITGGTQVMIGGDGLPPLQSTPNATVRFGATQVVGECDVSWCTAITPVASGAGPVNVTVSASGTTSAATANNFFTYTSEPKLARVDAFGNETSAGVIWTGVAALDGYAPSPGGTSITLTSSNPNLVGVQPSVTVPAGKEAVTFPLAVNPSPTDQGVTLTGSSNGTSISTTINVLASPALTLSIDATALDVGQSTDVSVGLNNPAPTPGGATVALVSSSGAITVPASASIAPGTYSTKFSITNKYSSGPQFVTISAEYNGALASDSVTVSSPSSRCATTQVCPALQHWDSNRCRCVRGIVPAR